MKPLPNDCARCMSSCGCSLASTCRRTTARAADVGPISVFPGGADCSGYWPETNNTKQERDQ